MGRSIYSEKGALSRSLRSANGGLSGIFLLAAAFYAVSLLFGLSFPTTFARPAFAQQPETGKTETAAGQKADNKPPAGDMITGADKIKTNEVAYEYNIRGRRDPFSPLIVKPEADKKKGYTPMENYEVAEFKLIAILWNKTGYYAVITLPDGKSYTIREGTKLGLHDGSVHKITASSVIIREKIRDTWGKISPKDTILKLRREDEG